MPEQDVISLSYTDTEIDIDTEIYEKSFEWKSSIESLVKDVGDHYGFECSRKKVFDYLDDVKQKGLENVSIYPDAISKKNESVSRLLQQIVEISSDYFHIIKPICGWKQKEIVENGYFDDFFNSYKALMGLANRKVHEESGFMPKENMKLMRVRLNTSNKIYENIIGNK